MQGLVRFRCRFRVLLAEPWLVGELALAHSCSQADIDAWHTGNDPHVRTTTRAFFQWCMASKLTRRLKLPPLATRHAAALPIMNGSVTSAVSLCCRLR